MRFMGRSFENQLGNDVGAHEAFMVPLSNFRFDMGRDCTADVVLNLVDDGILNDLAVLYHLRLIKQDERSRTESSGGNSTSDWMKKGTYPTSRCGMDGTCVWDWRQPEYTERATLAVSQIAQETKYVGQERDGTDCGLQWSNRSEPDDRLGT